MPDIGQPHHLPAADLDAADQGAGEDGEGQGGYRDRVAERHVPAKLHGEKAIQRDGQYIGKERRRYLLQAAAVWFSMRLGKADACRNRKSRLDGGRVAIGVLR